MKTTNKTNHMTLSVNYYFEGALIPMKDRDQLIEMMTPREIQDLEWVELQAKVTFAQTRDTSLYTDKVGEDGKWLSIEICVPWTWSPKHGTPITPETKYSVEGDTQGIFKDLPDCFDLANELDEIFGRNRED